ncbi:MAG: hypothetical protein B6I36_00710 [Desulfobacteraceae bacterium 4572_35.1]|nr:MAG: hypothetical protein B6I36_00710 [Desulfobacteraceae bacterium 4572_35.1]
MPPSEMPRSPRAPQRHRPIGVLVIIVVLSLIAFGLGVFVGKQQKNSQPQVVAPLQPHTPIKQNSDETLKKVPSKVEQRASNAVGVGKELSRLAVEGRQSIESLLTGKVEDQVVNEQVVEVATASAVVVEQAPLGNGINPARNSTLPLSPLAASPSPEVVSTATQVLQKKAAPAPAKVSAVVGKGSYVVQVSSFKKRSDAERVEKKIQAKFHAYVNRVDLGKKGVWYRVLVGPVTTLREAGKLKEQVQKTYRLSGFVKKVVN